MAKLDKIIHQPTRLQLMAALSAAEERQQIEFQFLKTHFQLTPGNLGAHLTLLEKEGYINIEKTFVNRRPRTYVSATAKGRRRFQEHVEALKQIVKEP